MAVILGNYPIMGLFVMNNCNLFYSTFWLFGGQKMMFDSIFSGIKDFFPTEFFQRK